MEKEITEFEVDEGVVVVNSDNNALDVEDDGEISVSPRPKALAPYVETPVAASSDQTAVVRYIFLPLVFLTVALFGGMRFGAGNGAFLFLPPELICLIFAAVTMVLFVRAGLIDVSNWIGEELDIVRNIANGTILVTLFAATTQLYNSLLPERGLPLWIVSFCFLWTLWNNLFAEFDAKKMLRSLGALFGFAFVAKYLILANLTAPVSDSWLQSLIQNPAKQTATWLLDLPQFSSGTGYLQFFTVALYLAGLFLVPRSMLPLTIAPAKRGRA